MSATILIRSPIVINVSGLIVPGRNIARLLLVTLFSSSFILRRHVQGITSRTATAIRSRGREFLVGTQHQVSGADAFKVAMLNDAGSHLITSGDFGATMRTTRQMHATYAFNFTEPCKDRAELRSDPSTLQVPVRIFTGR